MAFDVDEDRKVSSLMVNAAAGHGYAFATSHGITVGSRVGALKTKEHPKYIGSYGYGDAFVVHQGKHRWLTFFATGRKMSSTVYSIVVSSSPKPVQGR